ncbi:MAG: hypothetical protein LBB77_02335 [Treponema sp.]|jgi:hypothetical protein|nr:hypothetical protein [Treponema sp.]
MMDNSGVTVKKTDASGLPGGGSGGNEGAAGLGEKRELKKTVRKGLQIRDVLLIGILLAAGAVLRTAVGTVINFGMKPNFIIAMYCLTILLIRPGLVEAAIIGILSGAVCQLFPGQPYINFVSELLGALSMCLLIRVPVAGGSTGVLRKTLEAARIIGCTFLSTLVSGFSFIAVMYLMYYSGAAITPTPLAIFLAIIFGTALINSVIVQILYIPLKLALKRNDD